MPLTPEFEEFYDRWLDKADSYSGGSDRDSFDQFFTLYVLFNRLYAEATFTLARRGDVDMDNWDSFPDSKAAKEYLLKYVGARSICDGIDSNQDTAEALWTVAHLLELGWFSIKLDMITGDRLPKKDKELLAGLRSNNRGERARTILDAIYSVRCNLFHGRKRFNPVQAEILWPLNKLLYSIIGTTYARLTESD